MDTEQHVRTTFSATIPSTGITIAGNWRADNANELRSTLSLHAHDDIPQILAEGWKLWGKDLPNRLKGPFAFCLIDTSQKKLFAARDAFGVEPLFIAQRDNQIALASGPKIARSCVGLGSSPHLGLIADFLRGEITTTTGTFHKDLERLPPAHTIEIDASLARSVTRYFNLQDVSLCASEPDAIDRFRDLLDTEIRLCGANADHVGIMLSGGLDSSAIAGAVAHLRDPSKPYETFSMTYHEQAHWSDGPFIEAMRSRLGTEHHERESSQHNPMANMPELLDAMDGPCFGYGVSANCALFPLASASGVRTFFSGHGGDEVVSYGIGRLNELAHARRWATLWRESKGASFHFSRSRMKIMDRYLQHLHQWRKLRAAVLKVAPVVISSDRAARKENAALTTELAASYPPDKIATRSPDSRADHTERDLHEFKLQHPIQAHANETFALIGRYYGLDIAVPFYSRELVEFSLSLPSRWKLQNGYTRHILRESMRGRVPESVVARGDKYDFTEAFTNGVRNSEEIRDLATSSNTSLQDYVDYDWLNATWARMIQRPVGDTGEDARALWRVAVLAQWLDSDRDACLKEDF